MESLSPSPWLKQFDEYHIAPAYGVFGFVNQIRLSPVIETKRSVRTEEGEEQWEELELKCLPGRVDSIPCVPYFPGYHYRLDWDVWIKVTASLEHPYSDRSRFLPNSLAVALSRLLLEEEDENEDDTSAATTSPVSSSSEKESRKDVDVRSLFRNPPPKTPTHVKVSLRKYEYTDITTLLRTGHWWKRSVVPPSSRGGNNIIILDRDIARRIAGNTGKMSLEQQRQQQQHNEIRTRFPPSLKDIPHSQRDSMLIVIAVHIVFGLIKSNKMIVVCGILAFLLQWCSVVDISMIGILFVFVSLVGYVREKRVARDGSASGSGDIKPASRRE